MDYKSDIAIDLIPKLKVMNDNQTRWNSIYLMLRRALVLRFKLEALCTFHVNEILDKDILTSQDWEEVKIITEILKPFYDLTMRLQGNAKDGTKGSLWEVLVSFEIILNHLEAARKKYLKIKTYRYLPTCINAAWAKAEKYYALLDDSPMYAAAVLLHPGLKWQFFRKHWSKKKQWIQRYEKVLSDVWVVQYNNKSPPSTRPSSRENEPDIFEEFLALNEVEERGDEYQTYCQALPVQASDLPHGSPISWWSSHEGTYPNLAKWAYDLLSIPAMSAECERAFSSCGLLLEPRRNRLLDDIVEANECLRAWKRQDLF